MAKDKIYQAVKTALIKDGWIITDDPFQIESGGVEVDLAAEKLIAAERGPDRILIEIKSLSNRSLLYDFHAAIGQYLDYRGILRDEGIERKMYLAISETIDVQMKERPFYARRIAEHQLKLIVIDIENQTVVQWKE